MIANFQRCAVDYSVFIRRCTSGNVVLAIYFDDILLIDSDTTRIMETKDHLRKHFVTKNMGKAKYFLDIKFAYGRDKIVLSQRKYALIFSKKQDSWAANQKILQLIKIQISRIVLLNYFNMLEDIGGSMES